MDLTFDDLVPKRGDKVSDLSFSDLITGKQAPSAAEDVVKSAAAAVPRGMASTYGLPGDVQQGVGSFMEFLAAKAGGLVGVPEERFYGLAKDARKNLPVFGNYPTSDELRGLLDNVVTYQPQTEVGKRVAGVTEVAAGGVSGGTKKLPSLLSGLGSEGMGMLTNDNPYAKMAGAFLAPSTAGVYNAYRSTPGQMIREATGPLTQQQIEQAKSRMAAAKSQGIDLMGPEALPVSGIQQLASDVASSKTGGRVINQFMEQRPAQVKGAVQTKLLDEVGGQGTPDANMARARETATNVISDAERARTAAVRPDYKAARADVVAPEGIQAIVDQIDNALPYMSPQSKAAALQFRESVVGTNPNAAALDDVYKTTRNTIDLPGIGATPEQKTAAGVLGPFNKTLDETLQLNSPNLQAGRQKYKQITEDVVDPLTSGPVGRVAGRQGFDPSVPESLNPLSAISNEKVVRPESIRELYTNLNKKDAQAFPGMARTWLENAFDQAGQKVQAGENRMIGANFAKSVYGTPQQEANFLETMRGVAVANGKNPDDFAKGAKTLLETLQLTGKVPGIGSPTGGRIAANEMASSSGLASVAESASAAPLTGVAKKLRQWAMQGNYKQLAEVMTSPDSIDKIIQLGKYQPHTTTAQYFAAGVLGANASGQ